MLQLAEALVARDDVARVVVVAESGSIVEAGLEPGPRLRVVPVKLPARLGLAGRVAWETARLPGIAATERADAVLTFSGMVPRHPSCRVISLVSQPRPFERRGSIKRLLQRRAIARTARRAHRLYVPSRAMAALVGDPDARVVPHGVDHDLFHPAGEPGDEVLVVGDSYRHKRHELILEAWSGLPGPRPRLRLIGNPAVDRGYFEEIRRRARDPLITVAAQVGLDELLSAYRRARVFVIASEHESFAMPLAEALASGVPAVARDLPALRETGGPGAIFVAGDDPASWTNAIAQVISNDATHRRLRSAGLRHAQAYSWSSVAETLVADVRS